MSDSPSRPERLAEILREIMSLSRKMRSDHEIESDMVEAVNDRPAEIGNQNATQSGKPRPD